MKIATNAPDLQMGNVGTTGQFTIKATAHSFRILSSGLYSNKIKAIIRELSCNAVDSQVEAGTNDKPFLVHLPNQLEPYFSVRDYGTGLTPAGVMQVYTRYFESTKQDSNDYIGALGLGSKSPFSYTDNFTVTAIVDGEQTIYSAFIDETGCPSIAEMGACDTDEPNGVEVKFSVTDRNDIYRFASEATEVFKWFKSKPTVVGSTDYRERSPEIVTENVSPGVHLTAYSNRPVAVQGNIAYPISLPQSPETDELRDLLRCGLLIEFNIGDVDIAASREELSYTPATIAAIVARYKVIRDDVVKFIDKEMATMDNEWTKALRLLELNREDLFKSSVKEYVKNGGCKLLSINDYGSVCSNDNILSVGINDLAEAGLLIRMFKIDTWRKTHMREVKPDTDYVRDANGQVDYAAALIKKYRIPLHSNIEFVINDTKHKIISRVRDHYLKEAKNEKIVILLDVAPEYREKSAAVYSEFMDSIFNPPVNVVPVSSLPKRERVSVAKRDVLAYARETYRYSRWDPQYAPKIIDFTEDPKETYWYVPLSNFTPQDKDGKDLDKGNFDSVMINMSKAGMLTGRTIYGVRKGSIAAIKQKKNWHNVYDVVKKELKKFDASVLLSTTYKKIVSSEIINTHMANNIANLSDDSAFKKFCAKVHPVMKLANTSRDEGNEAYVWLLSNFNVKTNITVNANDVKKEYQDLFEIYPMLSLLLQAGCNNNDTAKFVTEYINLIDNTRGNTK